MATKGQEEARKKKRERTDFFAEYGKAVPDLRLAEQEFRFTLIRGGLAPLGLDRFVETCEWRDESGSGDETGDDINRIPMLRGSITLRKPQTGSPGSQLHVRTGDVVKCEVRWGGRWTEVWRMRLGKPSLQVTEGVQSFEMADDLKLLSESVGTFKFRRGKRRRRQGWFYHEVVRSVCRSYRVPVGKLTRGTFRIKDLSLSSASPLEVIRRAVEEEVKYTGRRLVIVWQFDKKTSRSGLNVLPMRRNPYLYLFEDLIRSLTLSEDVKPDRATALIVRASAKKGKKKVRKKVRVRVVSADGVRRFGYIQREETVKADSAGEARSKGKKLLAMRLKPKRVIEDFQHDGIAFIRRGDAIRISIPEEGYNVGLDGVKKDRWNDPAKEAGVVFVTSVTHSLSGGDYTMSMSVGFADPLDPNKLREEREKAARARKRAARGKKS